jgi:molybdopterin converting factor small subunit
MRVTVLCFGVLKELLGFAAEELELTAEDTVGDLLRILEMRASNVSMVQSLWKSVAVAVNRQYETAGCVLHEGDEVALLPPVSGGMDCLGLASEFEREWNAA